MFNHLSNLIRNLKSALSGAPKQPEAPAAAPVRKHVKKRRRQRHPEDAAYIRRADRRPAPAHSEKTDSESQAKQQSRKPRQSKQAKNQQPAQDQQKQQKQPKQQKQLQAEKRVKQVPPMPAFVPPPEEPGKMRFCDLELCPEVLAAVQVLGFLYCTEIQKLCLPYALAGRDLAAKAQTGTGKTAAFLSTLITRFRRHPLEGERKNGAPRALVLAPTRELAIQIHDDAEALARFTDLNCVVIFGGMDHEKQRRELDAPIDILVGTPGRIIDYSRSGDLDLSKAEVLVIDEADRMLDMGFIPDVRRIVYHLPRPGVRQTMLFSATLEPAVLRLVDSWMKDPEFVESEPQHIVTDLIDQRFYAVLDEQKMAVLLHVIREEKPERMIIFGNRKDKNISIAARLFEYGEDAELLSGDVAQEKRLKILDRFREGKTRILVATDVAARGIHVDGISHVVNYDLPEQSDDYVHRIGRTGRAGEHGTSISFADEFGSFVLPQLEQYTKCEIKTVQPPQEWLELPEKTRELPPEERKRMNHRGGGSGGGRPHRGGGRGRGRR
ncbi:MAG: DEAD/DEAH box helicase [Lentisphaeria bacterium]|nr:DEAD/DEAH box helicase [Lentisphaeria bacterium]